MFKLKYSDQLILAAMAEFADAHYGIPPTVRQLMECTGFTSTSSMSYRLNRLVDRGLLYKIDDGIKTSRGITITEKGRAKLKREKVK